MNTRDTLLEAKRVTGAEQAYNCGLALQFALLEDCLRRSGTLGASMAEHLQQQLVPLRHLNAQEFVSQGTPFFWMNIGRSIDQLTRRTANFDTLGHHLLVTAFDSYFEHLPIGTRWALPVVEGSNLVLPRLGVRVPQSELFTELCRISDRVLACSSSKCSVLINLDQIDAKCRLPMLSIPDCDSAMLLMSNDPELFEQDYVADIAPDLAEAASLAQMIGKALMLIKKVVPEIGDAIIKRIRWYVPLKTPEVGVVHNSHTSSNLSGVIFLSEAADEIDLAEAIIHEFCHTELFILMDTQDVIQEKVGEKFYSPWRSDPRPLYGLFHALYVFVGVANFYSKAEAFYSDPEQVQQLRERRSEIYYQVRLGLDQVPSERLAEIGHQIVQAIYKDLERDARDLSLSSELPSWLKHHLEAWCAENLELPGFCHSDEMKINPKR
ncbi:MAG: hypothetical protein KME38_28470 [Spirirestis rafaelensis WJT71-NPBG6]|jgi:HEXXH motif-containing protein|nr:hypothetical protein [Spirirestis rafaelensis WJT71-NPBG6]